MLIREKLGKGPIESNETNIDDIITENLAFRKVLSHSNTNEKSLNMLIKSSRKSHDKKGTGCEQNNSSTTSSHSRLSTNIPAGTFKNTSWRKTNMKGPKLCGYQKRKLFLLKIYYIQTRRLKYWNWENGFSLFIKARKSIFSDLRVKR